MELSGHQTFLGDPLAGFDAATQALDEVGPEDLQQLVIPSLSILRQGPSHSR